MAIEPIDRWCENMSQRPHPLILRTGAKPWKGTPPSTHREHAPHAEWIGTDIEPGEGVDIVGDLMELDRITALRFDGVFSFSTLEHINKPWLAMDAIRGLLEPGGMLLLHTHQTFPLHGYPSDYFRFSAEALSELASYVGLVDIITGYEHACVITPPKEITIWNVEARAWLNVWLCATKPA